jgi:hypothetical protein
MEVSLRRCQATRWGESLVAIMALHTLSATASVCLRLSLSLSLSLCVCVHVSLPASLSVCVCLPVCVSLYVCILPAGLSVSCLPACLSLRVLCPGAGCGRFAETAPWQQRRRRRPHTRTWSSCRTRGCGYVRRCAGSVLLRSLRL